MEKYITIERAKPTQREIIAVGQPFVSVAMEKIKEGSMPKGLARNQIAIFVKGNRFIRLTDTNVARVGNKYVSLGDLSNGLVLESFSSYKGQVTKRELTYGFPRSDKDRNFEHLKQKTTHEDLNILAIITQDLKVAKKISLEEFDKAFRTYNRILRRKNGRRV